MLGTPPEIIYDPDDVLPVLRVLLSNDPGARCYGAETLVGSLHAGRFLPGRPATFEVEAALEALMLGAGEVTA